MLSIGQAHMPECESAVRELFAEYLQWGDNMLRQEYSVVLDIALMLEDDMTAAGKFAPPTGCLLLAELDGRVAGCACMRQIGHGIGELKRMYVRPAFRGAGIGRALLEAVLERARRAGYATVRLDSAGFMREAHALYRSAGFRDVEPYDESEIPAQFRHHWVFMEKPLVPRHGAGPATDGRRLRGASGARPDLYVES